MTSEEAHALEYGALVRLNAEGLESGLQGHARSEYGMFLGMTRTGYMKVRRAGRSTVATYHPKFWEIVP